MPSLAEMRKEILKKKEIKPEKSAEKPIKPIIIKPAKKPTEKPIIPEPETDFNKSLELNLIKSIYANRFGSTTNKLKSNMQQSIMDEWQKDL